jgi:hypothetical protein
MVDAPTVLIFIARIPAEEDQCLGLDGIVGQALDGGQPAPEIVEVREALTPNRDQFGWIGDESMPHQLLRGFVPKVGEILPMCENYVADSENALVDGIVDGIDPHRFARL